MILGPTCLELTALIGECKELIPDDDDDEDDNADQGAAASEPYSIAYAQDASIALAHALNCLLEVGAGEAAWAANSAYEAIDRFVVYELGIGVRAVGGDVVVLDVAARGGEAAMLSHPVIQAELARQAKDLALLAVDAGVSRARPDQGRSVAKRECDGDGGRGRLRLAGRYLESRNVIALTRSPSSSAGRAASAVTYPNARAMRMPASTSAAEP